MRFVSGIIPGIMLTTGVWTVSAQERERFHPPIVKALDALREARIYLAGARHVFGGHKAEALRAVDEAIRQLNFALAYRER